MCLVGGQADIMEEKETLGELWPLFAAACNCQALKIHTRDPFGDFHPSIYVFYESCDHVCVISILLAVLF